MQPFDFEAAKSEQAALQAHAKSGNSRFLAGGTTLVDLMKLHVEKPDRVVDVTALPLNKITDTGHSLEIGALVSNTDLAQNALVKKQMPFLAAAVLAGASVQLRNLASVGGNLLQRTRCAYFRDTACACNKRELGSGCSAIDGFNRYNAVLGTSAMCIATNASDMCVPLAAMDAKVHLLSAEGSRVVPFSNFYRKPGERPDLETALRENELITKVEVPKLDWYARSHYVKVRDRASYAFALTSVAVALDLRDGLIRDARLALGGVGTIPWRALEAESALIGKPYSEDATKAAAQVALKGAKPFKFNAFKIELAQLTICRAVDELVRSSQGGRA